VETDNENPLIHRVFTALETLSAEEKNRILAQKREESLMNERYELAAARRKGWKDGRKDGKKEGREEEKKEIAASMLKDGMTAELIAKYTGLSADKIRRLNRG
jgi:predicted transposase/invertase (TIGR01784 family)